MTPPAPSPLVFVSAGEASGDARAAELIREARRLDPSLRFFGLGGPLMAAEGVELLEDMTRVAHVGLGDVLRNYFHYRRIFYRALKEVELRRPDCLLLVDYPGFNLRFAKKIRKRFPVLYYVSPQVWAWGRRRVRTIERVVSKMLLLFDFEREVYKGTLLEVEVVGHPLVGKVKSSASRDALRKEFGLTLGVPALGLLPGSREQEIRRILPVMLETAALLKTEKKDLEFVLSEAPHLPAALFDSILRACPLVIRRVRGRSEDAAAASDMALVTSGTATLETALVGTPFFILYKTGWLTYQLARRLIQIPCIGLVNVVAGKMIVPEFLQNDARAETIAHEALFVLNHADVREKMVADLVRLNARLGEPGAGRRAARALIGFLAAHPMG